MGRIIGGLVIAAIGILITLKAEWIYQNFGGVAWAESKMGTAGGSRTFYKLLGLGITMIGFLIMTNLFGGFLEATVGRLLIPQQR